MSDDWFIRHANRQGAMSFINVAPLYFASECADAINSGRLGYVPEVREACALICEEQAELFLSPDYATNQPFGSLTERFACSECAEAIRASVTGTGTAETRNVAQGEACQNGPKADAQNTPQVSDNEL